MSEKERDRVVRERDIKIKDIECLRGTNMDVRGIERECVKEIGISPETLSAIKKCECDLVYNYLKVIEILRI